MYDILKPTIQRTDHGRVVQVEPALVPSKDKAEREPFQLDDLRQFAERLVSKHPVPDDDDPGQHEEAVRPDDYIAHLIRSCPPARYDIHNHSEPVATIHLPSTHFRASHTIPLVISINSPSWPLQVVKISAGLVTTERIPRALLPPLANRDSEPKQPLIERTVAGDGNGFTADLNRIVLGLQIPLDAVPSFHVNAVGPHEQDQGKAQAGGLAWTVKVRFLIRRRLGWMPNEKATLDENHTLQAAGPLSTQTVPVKQGQSPRHHHRPLIEVVSCTIPITVHPRQRSYDAPEHAYTFNKG